MEKEQREQEEEPDELTFKTVVKWSKTYKQLQCLERTGKFKTYTIRWKARRFIENGCIDYDKEKKCYLCRPIEGYNNTTYELTPNHGEFECNCQFFQNVVKKQEAGLICSHVLALKLQLKIWNWQRRKDKEKFPESYK